MEDPSEEYWEVDDYSQPNESKGKLGLIWTKGLNLVKKMVITGAVISSAPFVVPPLMALSVIGFACSVPAGFVFVTYACSEKLMNKLLPVPSLALLEDEMIYYNRDIVNKGHEEDASIIDTEEIGFGDDTRIELVEERDEKTDGYDRILVSEIVEEEDEEKPVNFSGVDGEEIRRGTIVMIEEMRDGGIYETTAEENEGKGDIGVKDENDYDGKPVDEILVEDEEKPLSVSGVDEEEMRRETTGLIEEMRDEGKYDQQCSRDIVGEETTAEENEGKGGIRIEDENDYDGKRVDEIVAEDEEKPPSVSGVDEEEMRMETTIMTGLIEEMRDEGKYDKQQSRDIVGDETTEESGGKREIAINDVKYEGIKNDLFVIPEEGRPDDDAKGVTNGSTSEETVTSLSSVGANEEVREVKPEGERKLVVEVKKSENSTSTEVHFETNLDEKTGTLVMSDVDATDTADESGLDLFDQPTPLLDQTGDPVNDVSTGVCEVLIETTLIMSEHSGEASSQDSNQDSTAETGKVKPSKEKTWDAKPSEEKIWENINAMRTIVGYKAAPHSSCIEELNALYIFTGVEPPISVKDRVDLIDIDEKLHFLMSIVGVK